MSNTDPQAPQPLAAAGPASLVPPSTGHWDCHCHVFGPVDRFPYAADRPYTPADAPATALQAMHRRLGIERAVLVQAACHGHDHSALLDAISASQGRHRGIALLATDTTPEDISRLHAGGVRGARLNFVAHLGAAPSTARVRQLAALIEPFGWHLCLHADGAALAEWLPILHDLPVPFVIDHMARLDASAGLDQPAMRLLLSLANCPRAWVKISAIDRAAGGQAPYVAGLSYVRALIDALPERVLWGSDWPHPNIQGATPDDAHLLGLLAQACPDARRRQQILARNPLPLYGD